MQPCLIRVIDNLRKRQEISNWKGEYEETLMWPEGTSEEQKARVNLLNQELESASGQGADSLRQALWDLPSPYPGYRLRLSSFGQEVIVDIWDLCYQVCFRNYDKATGTSWVGGFSPKTNPGVEVDETLFDEDDEIDWVKLDQKAQQVIERVFVNLPEQL